MIEAEENPIAVHQEIQLTLKLLRIYVFSIQVFPMIGKESSKLAFTHLDEPFPEPVSSSESLCSPPWQNALNFIKSCLLERSSDRHTQLVILNLPFPFVNQDFELLDSDSEMSNYIHQLEFLTAGIPRLL